MDTLTSHLLEEILYRAEHPVAFLASRGWLDTCRPTMTRLISDNPGWISKIGDPGLSLTMAATCPDIDQLWQLHPTCRRDRSLALLILERSDGFQYGNLDNGLANDVDIIRRGLELSRGYIYGLLPPVQQTDDSVIRLTALHMLDVVVNDDDDMDKALSTINAIVTDAWEDILPHLDECAPPERDPFTHVDVYDIGGDRQGRPAVLLK